MGYLCWSACWWLCCNDVAGMMCCVWGDPASPAAPPDVITWLDSWDKLERCGRDGWPQLIRVPAFLVDRQRDEAETGLAFYRHEEAALMLREAAEFSRQQRVRLPLVTLEPTEDGVYRIMEEPSDEPVLAARCASICHPALMAKSLPMLSAWLLPQ